MFPFLAFIETFWSIFAIGIGWMIILKLQIGLGWKRLQRMARSLVFSVNLIALLLYILGCYCFVLNPITWSILTFCLLFLLKLNIIVYVSLGTCFCLDIVMMLMRITWKFSYLYLLDFYPYFWFIICLKRYLV